MEKLSTSEWIAVIGGIIALLAFFTTVWQAHLTRTHNHLSSRPVLDIEIHCQPDETIGFLVANCGPGPAFVESAVATFRKVTYSLCVEEEFAKLNVALGKAGLKAKQINMAIPSANSVIPSGMKYPLFVIRDSENRDQIRGQFDSLSKEISLTIAYKSLYEHTYKTGHDVPVATCA